MIPVRFYIYAGIALVGILIAWGIHSAYTNWQDGVKQVAWQEGYDVAHAEVTAVLNEERAAVQAERDASERKARQTEQAHREALDTIATQYEQDKANAEQEADRVIADLRDGNRQLRAHWQASTATCGLVSATAVAASQPDDDARLREADIGRVLSIVGTCQAQRDGLQAVIRADRGMQP